MLRSATSAVSGFILSGSTPAGGETQDQAAWKVRLSRRDRRTKHCELATFGVRNGARWWRRDDLDIRNGR